MLLCSRESVSVSERSSVLNVNQTNWDQTGSKLGLVLTLQCEKRRLHGASLVRFPAFLMELLSSRSSLSALDLVFSSWGAWRDPLPVRCTPPLPALLFLLFLSSLIHSFCKPQSEFSSLNTLMSLFPLCLIENASALIGPLQTLHFRLWALHIASESLFWSWCMWRKLHLVLLVLHSGLFQLN